MIDWTQPPQKKLLRSILIMLTIKGRNWKVEVLRKLSNLKKRCLDKCKEVNSYKDPILGLITLLDWLYCLSLRNKWICWLFLSYFYLILLRLLLGNGLVRMIQTLCLGKEESLIRSTSMDRKKNFPWSLRDLSLLKILLAKFKGNSTKIKTFILLKILILHPINSWISSINQLIDRLTPQAVSHDLYPAYCICAL